MQRHELVVPVKRCYAPRQAPAPRPLCAAAKRIAPARPNAPAKRRRHRSGVQSRRCAAPAGPPPKWLRGLESNQRPRGYEPRELPLLHPAQNQPSPAQAHNLRWPTTLLNSNASCQRNKRPRPNVRFENAAKYGIQSFKRFDRAFRAFRAARDSCWCFMIS